MALLLPASPLVGPPYLMSLAEAVLELRPTTLHVGESLASMRDITASQWDAAYTGSPVLASPPLPTLPRGVTFSGTGQYATTSTSVPKPTTGVSVLVALSMTDATASTRVLCGVQAASQNSWAFRLGATHLATFVLFQSGGSFHATAAATGAVNDGLPHLVVGSFDGTTARSGRDGAAAATSTSLTGSWHTASTAALQIAAAASANLIPATIYLVAYWVNRIITDAERFRLNWIMRRG